MSGAGLNSIVVAAATAVALLVVFRPRVVASTTWQATVTPLASIIGSGFLILGPLLQVSFGALAPAVMLGLCAVAYAFGAAIRYNIAQYDSRKKTEITPAVRRLEEVAAVALAGAYVVSVCYYLNLFGSFAVSLTPFDDAFHARLVTTGMLLFVGIFGWLRGLEALEKLEEGTVGLKLAIIAGLLMGLIAYAMEGRSGGGPRFGALPPLGFDSVATAFGLVVTVQGFETSRYLGEEYDAATRVRTMKLAQWFSAGIYLLYIVLITVSFANVEVALDETAIVDMTRVVSPILPGLLVCAALAAQLSAAVADSGGCGGLAEESSRKRIRSKTAYLLVAGIGVLITWAADIFSIISYASKAFAIYYALQSTIAAVFAWQSEDRRRVSNTFAFGALAVFAIVIVALGRSAE